MWVFVFRREDHRGKCPPSVDSEHAGLFFPSPPLLSSPRHSWGCVVRPENVVTAPIVTRRLVGTTRHYCRITPLHYCRIVEGGCGGWQMALVLWQRQSSAQLHSLDEPARPACACCLQHPDRYIDFSAQCSFESSTRRVSHLVVVCYNFKPQ